MPVKPGQQLQCFNKLCPNKYIYIYIYIYIRGLLLSYYTWCGLKETFLKGLNKSALPHLFCMLGHKSSYATLVVDYCMYLYICVEFLHIFICFSMGWCCIIPSKYSYFVKIIYDTNVNVSQSKYTIVFTHGE